MPRYCVIPLQGGSKLKTILKSLKLFFLFLLINYTVISAADVDDQKGKLNNELTVKYNKSIQTEKLIYNAIPSGGLKSLISKGFSTKMEFTLEPIKGKTYKGYYKIKMCAHSEEAETKKNKHDKTIKHDDDIEGQIKLTVADNSNLSMIATSYINETSKGLKPFFKAKIRNVKDDFSDMIIREIVAEDYEKKSVSTNELMESFPVYDLNCFLFLARYVKKFDATKEVYFFEKGLLRPVSINFSDKEKKINYKKHEYITDEFIVSCKNNELFKFYISKDSNRLPLVIKFNESSLELIEQKVNYK